MTDLFNTKENQDRQQSAVKDSNEPVIGNPSSILYDQGKKLLNRFRFNVTPDMDGPYANHTVSIPTKPTHIPGITYPAYFEPDIPIHTFEQQDKIERIFSTQSEEVFTFWRPFFAPQTTRETPFHAYTERLIRLDNQKRELNEFLPFDFGLSFDPDGSLSGKIPKVFHPKQWVPARDWFHPAIRQLRFHDIFTIWPKAEANLLRLILGRICVGRNNHIPYGWDSPIEHTTRIAAIVVGEDAGLGKSTIFNALWKAISLCGYKVSTFRQITERFGIEEPAKADVAYKDDVVSSSLRSFVCSEETKIITTGGKLRVEAKFQAPVDVWPRGVLLLNANEFDPQISYNLDPGIIDRVKLLATIRHIELASRKAEIGGITLDSPDIRPASHLPWLAETLSANSGTTITVDAIMLWACRLATDYFYDLMARTTRETNQIERQVHHDTSHLRLTLDKSVTRSFITSLILAYLIRHPEHRPGFQLPEMNIHLLSTMLRDFYYIAVDPDFAELRTALKAHWDLVDRPEIHPWVGIRKTQLATVKKAIIALTDSVNRQSSLENAIKATFEQILLRNGFKLSHSVVWLTNSWQSVSPATPELLELCNHLVSTVTVPATSKTAPDDAYLFDPLYNPKTVEQRWLQKVG